MNKIPFLILLVCILISCSKSDDKLPIIGKVQIIEGDTIYHQVGDFSMLNTDSTVMTQKDFQDQIYLADFFFTHCPSICPKVTKQMLRLYDHYENDSRIKLVSFTIDPKRDDVATLKLYAQNLEVDPNKWIFLTGDKEKTLDLADEYFVTAYEDPDVPGGFDHSGKILLVDGKRHIRSFAEGTDPESVTKLFKDIDRLLDEKH